MSRGVRGVLFRGTEVCLEVSEVSLSRFEVSQVCLEVSKVSFFEV